MSLHTLFSPKSIVVIGASTQAGSVGNDIAKNLVQSDFRGTVFLVNPKGGELFGKVCYPSIGALPEQVDLALIVVPAAIVPQVLREAGEHMTRAAIIISAGFRETGPAGRALEEEIIAIAQEYKLELLGPNCLGFIRPKLFLNASFASTHPVDGPVAFFSQSGALASAFLDKSRHTLGFSTFVSIGNKASIDEGVLLSHFEADEATRVIGFYTEGLTDAARIVAQGQSLLKKKKPTIVLKSGVTTAGSQASSSHTGAVAGSDAAYTAIFRQAGILRAAHFQDLLELLTVFATTPLPKGNRVAIITNAGGLGVLATDALVQNGLVLAPLTADTITTLKTLLPAAANTHNPVDVLGDALAERYQQALRTVAQDKNVDMLLVILTPQTMTEDAATADVIIRLKRHHPRLPIVTVFSGDALTRRGEERLRAQHIVNTAYPERAARMLGALATMHTWQSEIQQSATHTLTTERDIASAQALIAAAKATDQTYLGEAAASRLLKSYGLPFLESALATTPEAAEAFARKIGKPVALKIASPDIVHKSDVGGVMLDVDLRSVASAYTQLIETVAKKLPQVRIDGVMLAEMAAPKSLELLLGLKKEPGLGTLVVVGLGGIYVEVFQDIAMRFAPLTERDMDAMLTELKSAPLLGGARGQNPVDLTQIKRYLAALSTLALDFPEISELDINPLAIAPDGSTMRVLDARLHLKWE